MHIADETRDVVIIQRLLFGDDECEYLTNLICILCSDVHDGYYPFSYHPSFNHVHV